SGCFITINSAGNGFYINGVYVRKLIRYRS
ncbi:MAG: hypothetical protein ACI8UC_001671, partial [Psychromonas sp.]